MLLLPAIPSAACNNSYLRQSHLLAPGVGIPLALKSFGCGENEDGRARTQQA